MRKSTPRGGRKLTRYRGKRDFKRTPEPSGTRSAATGGGLQYVVQKHDATRLHYDFRLEHDGVLKSWAVPKEPSLSTKDRRLAVQTEDHPLDYGGFEGEIPEGEYGAGSVVIWDRGHWQPLVDVDDGLEEGKLDFELEGEKLKGRFTLVRMAERGKRKPGKDNWLLLKRYDKPVAKRKSAAPRARRKASAPPDPSGPSGGAQRPVKLTHPDKVLFPDPGITKRQLADYWQEVADVALPFLKQRPLTLFRCPDGYAAQCFYQKHVGAGVPPVVPRVAIKEGEDPYAVIDGVESLLGLVQIGVLELHVWGSRAEHLDKPDVIVLDLDPAPDVPWSEIAAAALTLKERVEGLGLNAFVKLTGGKGLHVVVPVTPGPTWPAVKKFTHAIVNEMVRDDPRRFIASMSKVKRTGKIFIDYLRNDAEATAIGAYSPRARAGAPVALPIEWDELQPDARQAPRFGILEVPKLIRARKRDPWQGFEAARRSLVD